jgi:hypothetical protein
MLDKLKITPNAKEIFMNCSRRTFLTLAGQLTVTVASGAFAQTATSASSYADQEAADKWIQQWIQSLGAAEGALVLGRFADRIYFLRKQIGWTPDPGQSPSKVQVPEGFVTDFASIPRIFWSLLPPDGLYTYAAIIHDYLYWNQSVSREEADLVLRYAMEDFHVDAVTINTIYAGVRAGGSFAWKDNAALKKAGEKRILKLYPEDPTVRWIDWKQRPDCCI